MEWVTWVFDGIGTEIISVVVGLIIGSISGGAVGYKIGTKGKVKQNQKAGHYSTQNQVGSVSIICGNGDKKDE